jgi:hypothetical protein
LLESSWWTNRALVPANSKGRTGLWGFCGLMRSPEWKWESNLHWKYSVLSHSSLPCPLHFKAPWALCQQTVTCQTDTPHSSGKGTPMVSRSTLWIRFLSAQPVPRQSKWEWEQGSPDPVEWKIWVVAWSHVIRKLTLLWADWELLPAS